MGDESNPYSAVGGPRLRREPSLSHALRRLRLLGADQEMLDDLAEHWDEFDDDWTPERRRYFVTLPDKALAEVIRSVREEWDFATTDEITAERLEFERRVATAEIEVDGRIGQSVAALLAWVGDDRARATALYHAESAADGQGRVTLLRPLEEMLATDAA